MTTSSGALIVALLTRDFGIEYVAQYTSRSLSVFYRLGAFWAGQAGRSCSGPGCSGSARRSSWRNGGPVTARSCRG